MKSVSSGVYVMRMLIWFLIIFAGVIFSFTLLDEKTAVSAGSQDIKIKSINIIDYGLYEAKQLGRIDAEKTTRGKIGVYDMKSLKLIKKTERIPAVLGNKFGFRYTIEGMPKGKEVMITVNILTPGLTRPGVGSPSHQEKWTTTKEIGEVTYDGFTFQKIWELVPGRWIIQISYEDKKLGEKAFEVYMEEKSLPSHIPPSVKGEMERLSSSDCEKRLNAVYQLADMGQDAIPAIPYLINNLRYYSMPHQIPFDCGSGKATPAVLANIGTPAINSLIDVLADEKWGVREGASEALLMMGKLAISPLIKVLREDSDPKTRLAAAEILGRIKDKQAVESLIDVLRNDAVPEVRGKAAKALAELRDERAVKALVEVFKKKEENLGVRSDALEALGKIGDKETITHLLPVLYEERNPLIKEKVVDILANVEGPGSTEYLTERLRDRNSNVRRSALKVLTRKKDRNAVGLLITALKDPAWDVRSVAASLLGATGDPKAINPLIQLLKDREREVRFSAALALGDLRAPQAVEPLIGMLKDQDEDVRRAGIGALGRIGDKRAFKPLMEILNDKSTDVRRETTQALGGIKSPEGINVLISIMKDEKFGAQNEAVTALANVGEPAVEPLIASLRGESSHGNRLRAMDCLVKIGKPAVEPLIKALEDREPYVREGAAVALGRIKDERAVTPLIETLNDYRCAGYSAKSLGMIGEPSVKPLLDMMEVKGSRVRIYVIEALGETGDKRAIEPLIKALEDSDPQIRRHASRALGQIKDEEAVGPLIRALKDQDSYVRDYSAEALGMIEDKRAVRPLLDLLLSDPGSRWNTIRALGRLRDKRATKEICVFLKDKNQQLRLKASEALGEIGDNSAVDALIETLNDEDRDVKRMAWVALRKVTKKNFGDDPKEWKKWLKRKGERSKGKEIIRK